MPITTTSPNMGLNVPVVSQEPGPQYAVDVNACFAAIDLHDHSSGKGVQITPAGLNITSDLSIGGNNVTQVRSVRFNTQSTPLNGASDLGCLYESGTDLYYNDGSGNQVRITQSGGVAGSPGSIGGLVAPASVTYVAPTYVFQSGVNVAGNIDGRNFILRNSTVNSFGLTLSPPSGMGADFSIVLPSLPGSQSLMTINASGNIATPGVYPITVDSIAAATLNTSSFNNSVWATQAQMEAATDSKVIVSPSLLKNHPGIAKAWVKTAYSAVPSASYNLSSVVKNGLGNLEINWAFFLSSANYFVSATGSWTATGVGDTGIIQVIQTLANSTTVVNVRLSDATRQDGTDLYVAIFGDL